MSTALTVYGNQTVSATLGTANQLVSTNTGTTTSGISTLIGTAFGANSWGEFTSGGSAAAWPALASASAPTGKGWFLDGSTLEGQQLIAGNWQWVNRLKVSVGTATIDVMVRAYKYNGGTYTLIGSITLTGTSQNTVVTNFSSALTAFAAMNFTTGDRLYLDAWGNITANATGSSAATFQMQTCNNASLGRTNNMQMLTAGYQTAGTLVTKSLPVRLLLRTQSTRTLVTRLLLRTQRTLNVPMRFVERVTNTRSLPMRLLVRTAKSLSLPVRTLLNVMSTKTLTVRTILRAMTTRTLPVRTRIRVQISKTVAVRAIVRNTVTKTLGIRTRFTASTTRTLGIRIVLGIPVPVRYISVTWVTRDGKTTWVTRDDLATWKTRQ